MTPAQLKVLDAVRVRIDAGFTPTHAEIGRACGVTSQAVGYTLRQLVEMGHLSRHPRRHRAIALPDRPDLRTVSSEHLQAELARRGVTFGAIDGYHRPTMARGSVTCAADCCQQTVRRGHLFCRQHWFALPVDLQRRILSAFGAQDVEAYELAVTEARDRLDGSYFQRRDAERG